MRDLTRRVRDRQLLELAEDPDVLRHQAAADALLARKLPIMFRPGTPSAERIEHQLRAAGPEDDGLPTGESRPPNAR